MANEVTVQQKALTMRSFLEGDRIKNQLMMALPKWLSIDRFIRVAFTAVLKNPKLLDCTPESVASSFVQCASLGLEPILGRAHLVPYQNNTKPGRPLEMQMQVGYQGFIDLARRSGDIRDVKPFVVYEKDVFEIEYGDADRIMHKPFMGPMAERGKPIGGYVKWIFRDDYVSTHYISIDEIYAKHRAKSQAYNYAIGKGKTDTPWIEFEDIMIMKTLIKATARWEPASIEALQAVELDDFSDMGAAQPIIPIDIAPELEAPATEESAAQEEGSDPFLEMIMGAGYKPEDVEAFVAASAKQFEKTPEEVKDAALRQKDGFLAALKKHVEDGGSAPEKGIRDEFIRLKTKGFAPWVHNLGEEAYFALEEGIQKEVQQKWAGLYADPFPYPATKPEEEPAEEPAQEQDDIQFGEATSAAHMEVMDEKETASGDTVDAKYQQDMLKYMEHLGQDDFFRILKEEGEHRGVEEGYKSISDIPPLMRPFVLARLRQTLDEKQEAGDTAGEEA